ncbi:Hypothetical protein NTJ_02931 [Nesidiocoris tenuis]|uniref:Uncharacterized protein n=1 Tax=Nesidiocoris tenuis TaxID=355587 RepID=A0ABN7AFH2_9HEMI|nr:Hypothetical protein NTJ_02931 [Nesidiocoris tenuis]
MKNEGWLGSYQARTGPLLCSASLSPLEPLLHPCCPFSAPALSFPPLPFLSHPHQPPTSPSSSLHRVPLVAVFARVRARLGITRDD